MSKQDNGHLENAPTPDNPAPTLDSDAIIEAFREAVANEIAEHHRLGFPVCIGRKDGSFGWLYPDGSFIACDPDDPLADPPNLPEPRPFQPLEKSLL